jgi:hypothetical protein
MFRIISCTSYVYVLNSLRNWVFIWSGSLSRLFLLCKMYVANTPDFFLCFLRNSVEPITFSEALLSFDSRISLGD